MYTESYDDFNKVNIDQIIDNIDLETWDEDDLYFDEENEEWDLNNEKI